MLLFQREHLQNPITLRKKNQHNKKYTGGLQKASDPFRVTHFHIPAEEMLNKVTAAGDQQSSLVLILPLNDACISSLAAKICLVY